MGVDCLNEEEREVYKAIKLNEMDEEVRNELE